MGRAERRRLEREKSKAQKVYTLTQAQIDDLKKRAVDEAVNTAFILMLATARRSSISPLSMTSSPAGPSWTRTGGLSPARTTAFLL